MNDPYQDDLDPRRTQRHLRFRRDWASMSAVVAVPRMRELLAIFLVRAGFIR
ncbi:MAG: hypothetical protein JWM25_529 [Thermoleophilia bacterium]|nr:hypothetical protein [Thermoleophilia bacterium]